MGDNAPDKPRDESYELLYAKYKMLFDHARDMILFIDGDGRILDANPAAVAMYGYTKEELTSLYVFELRKFDSPEFVQSQMRRARESSIQFETVHKTKDGRTVLVEVSSTGVMVNGRQMLMSIIRDVSAKQRYLARIQHLAFYDELTGVPNRKSYRDAIRKRLASCASRFGLMLLDMDNFKQVNDSYSHFIGDAFLVETARAIERALAGRGTLYRLGGDEFTVISGDVSDRDGVTGLLADIRAATSRTLEIEGCTIRSSLSIGVAMFPDDGADEGLLLKCADMAMYRVKQSTRDGYAFFVDSL
jgi:diguanylate cyclase (GGDEF)-like protein/PAS domain S-box-containing protein